MSDRSQVYEVVAKRNMALLTEHYSTSVARLPKTGRHIVAQYDEASVVVYQAYRPAIAKFAVEHGYFGGEFSFNRMSWIKPNFLWMMYRSGWGTKAGQEVILAIRIKRSAFEMLLAAAVHSSFVRTYATVTGDRIHNTKLWKELTSGLVSFALALKCDCC